MGVELLCAVGLERSGGDSRVYFWRAFGIVAYEARGTVVMGNFFRRCDLGTVSALKLADACLGSEQHEYSK